jgi:hypothetical protein
VVGITHSDQGGWQARQMVSASWYYGPAAHRHGHDAQPRHSHAGHVYLRIDPFNNAEE